MSFLEVEGFDVSDQPLDLQPGRGSALAKTLTLPKTNQLFYLRKSVLPASHPIFDWADQVFAGKVETKALKIELLGADGAAIASWTVNGAAPTAMRKGALDAMTRGQAIEEVTMVHNGITRDA